MHIFNGVIKMIILSLFLKKMINKFFLKKNFMNSPLNLNSEISQWIILFDILLLMKY